MSFDAAAAAALEAACRQLSSDPNAQPLINRFVGVMTHLAQLAHGKPGTASAAFSDIGRATCRRELDGLAKHARKLADHIERMHEPTILALADVGLFGAVRLGLPAELRQIADQADRADVGQLPIKAGRGARPNLRTQTVGRIISRAYQELTGRKPTYTTDPATSVRSGAWPTFLESVFRGMKLDGYGDQLIRTLVTDLKPSAGDQRNTEELAN